MSGLIFCSFKRAARPYYLESAKQNIYSVEELCYFLQDNIYLLDENIMTQEFCDWLENEVEATELAHKLRRLMEDQQGFRVFCMQIIMDSGYFSKNEMQFLGMKLQKMDHQSNYENRKIKADQLMEKKKYLAAIAEYRSLLLHATDSPSDVRVSGQHHISQEQFAAMKKNLAEIGRLTEASADYGKVLQLMRLARVSPAQAKNEIHLQTDAWKDEYIAYKG